MLLLVLLRLSGEACVNVRNAPAEQPPPPELPGGLFVCVGGSNRLTRLCNKDIPLLYLFACLLSYVCLCRYYSGCSHVQS